MNLSELLKHLPAHPTDILEGNLGKQATENSLFLYEIHNTSFDFYESHIWVFDSIDDFINFLPAIVFNDIAVNWETYSEDEASNNYDYTNDYTFFKKLKKQQWNLQQGVDFVEKQPKFGNLELIEFGKLSDLIKVSQQEYDKCKNLYLTLDELTKVGLTQARYKIFEQFHKCSKDLPSKNSHEFLEMITNW